jgi:spore germination protein YaaH
VRVIISMTTHKHTQLFYSLYVSVLILGFLLVPAVAKAATTDVGVWIPYWSEEAGAENALENIKDIDVVYPFVFEVTTNGIPVNKVDFDDKHWEELFDAAQERDVPIIPTIAWFDGVAMHQVLSNDSWRAIHVKLIALYAQLYDVDGINIDYEQKLAATKDDFSAFLAELNTALGDKTLTCTVEARMRPERRYREVPATIEYANDYEAMNKHCDWIEIMAYDQQRADIVLNAERQGVPYMPVADIDWVEDVVELALEDFDKEKVMLGVATYGRAWDVTVAADWYKDYTKVATLNNPRIQELSEKYDSPIGRSEGGEAVISYFPEDSVWKIFNQLPTPEGTPKGYEAAAKALMVATIADVEIPVRFITWSDARSISDKVELAEEYGLKGVAVFKVDGEEDEEMWKHF